MKRGIRIALIVIAVLALVLTATGVIYFCVQQEEKKPDPAELKEISIFDTDRNLMISTKSVAEIYDTDYWAYLEIVLAETTELIAQQKNCSEQDAREHLFTGGYQIHTAFDRTVFEATSTAMDDWKTVGNTACAVTDLNGKLIAVYSNDIDGHQVNHTRSRRAPYSSFKALSVYTPAVDTGMVNWAKNYEDSPYKKLADEDGESRDWPANATGVYSYENVTVYDALRTSLNTVAVKCLADVGVDTSIDFLQDNFGMALIEEEYVLNTYGKEEVIGNVALGYLETGITPVEMAGYYQIFANGGIYSPVKTVNTIICEDGSTLYEWQDGGKRVVRAETADLMNKLLQGVVAPGGTGEQVSCGDVQVAGKTGTGDNNEDNWFVGVTPGYSLAVWHGKSDSNKADNMFASVVNEIYSTQTNANKNFVTHKTLYQTTYCVYSGKAISDDCTLIDIGFFENKDTSVICDVCPKSKAEG